MKNHSVTVFFLSLILSLGICSQSLAQNSSPTGTIQHMLDSIFEILRAPDFNLGRDKAAIEEAVDAAFDPNTIAQSALAASYRDLSTEQRAEFEAIFFQILKNTYIDRLGAYTDETTEITGEEVDGNRSTVNSIIYTTNSQITLDYSLRQRPNGWFIYDIVVEDVSLLSSYRSTYRSIIRRSGIDGLMSELRLQVNGLE
tara:strand:+ start:147989 stop:148585 length:597 start_codon:yes stop_codon:yes gene_type:complete